MLSFFFFFQAEDGIRDLTVTGVRRVLFRSAAPPSPSTSHESAPSPAWARKADVETEHHVTTERLKGQVTTRARLSRFRQTRHAERTTLFAAAGRCSSSANWFAG